MSRPNTAPVTDGRVVGSFRHATAPIGTTLRAPQLRLLRPDRERTPESGLYHAHIGIHTGTRKPISVWLLRPSLTPTAIDANQLVDDVIRAAQVRHTNIERFVDVGEHESGMYIAWERAPGTVAEVSYYAGDRLSVPRTVSGMAAALAVAHRSLLVHGCMTMGDVCLRNGTPTIMGIGVWSFRRRALAAVLINDPTSSIAPEVQMSGAVSPRADVYSLAAIATQLVLRTGTSLPVATLRASLAVQHPKMSLLHAALDPSPEKRPSDPLAVAAEFEECWRGFPPRRSRAERALTFLD